MALWQLQQTNQARLELAQYQDLIETNFHGPLELGSDLGKGGYYVNGPWHDWWIAHVLLREAEALEGGPVPTLEAVPDSKTNPPALDNKARTN
jgi:hypothetical protein